MQALLVNKMVCPSSDGYVRLPSGRFSGMCTVIVTSQKASIGFEHAYARARARTT
jgi:hypothetical protein